MIAAYPPARRTDEADTFHGVRVADPFGWLEVDTAATRAWLDAQQELAASALSSLPDRARVAALAARLPLALPERLPLRCGGSTFVFGRSRNDGASLLRKTANGETETVFDPADVAALEGRRLSPEFTYLSPDGRRLAAGLGEAGSDWCRVIVWEFEGSRLVAGPFPATGHPVIAWKPDGTGFYYNITSQTLGRAGIADGVWAHEVGADPSDDALVFDHRGGRGHAALPIVLRDGSLLVKTLDFVTQEAGLWAVAPNGAPRTLVQHGPRFNLVGETDGGLLLDTQISAPRGRVILIDPRSAEIEQIEIVAESPSSALAIASHSTWSPLSRSAGDRLFLTYVRDAAHEVVVFDLAGRHVGKVGLPSPCTVLELSQDGDGLEAAITGFLSPWESYAIEPRTLEVRRMHTVGPGVPIEAASCRQIFRTSGDGTRVPAFVIAPQKVAGPVPTLLYVYGGWGQSITPSFRPDLAVWVALGGAYAVANVRGGGEYGEDWHRAGMRMNKTNTFDDCFAVAEGLVAEGVAAPQRLCIRGLSNGGLVVAACINRRPELFAAASCLVPLVDVVHLMEMPAGASIAAEFGDPTADRVTFDFLLSYSPLQNVRASADRPPMLVIVGERDERAPPAWTYRYIAEVQATAGPGQIALLRVVPKEAHVGWPPDVERTVLEEEVAFLWHHANGPLRPERSSAT